MRLILCAAVVLLLASCSSQPKPPVPEAGSPDTTSTTVDTDSI